MASADLVGQRARGWRCARAISVDGGLQVSDRAEDAAADALAGHFGKESLDGVEPRGRGRSEVEDPTRMARQPGHAGRDLALDGIEKTDEFAVTVALHPAADHGAVEHAERGEQGRGAVPLIVTRHRLTAARLDRQSGLGAVERLDLALFVDRQHHGMGRRIDIKPDNVRRLGGKARVTRALESAQPVRLQFVRPPDVLHRALEMLMALAIARPVQ